MKTYISPTSPPCPLLRRALTLTGQTVTLAAHDTTLGVFIRIRGSGYHVEHTLGKCVLTLDQLTHPRLLLRDSLVNGTPTIDHVPAPKVSSPASVLASLSLPPPPSLQRTYIPGHGDTHWEWNCGWRCYRTNPFTSALVEVSPRPLGHLAFRALKLPNKHTFTDADHLSSTVALGRRATSDEWRRYITEDIGGRTLYTHSEFGEGFIMATDGLHAIFKTNSNCPQVLEVMFANLTEWKPARRTNPFGDRTPRAPKTPALPAGVSQAQMDKFMSLDLDSFLDL